jgi:hypothetical protein
MKNRLLLFIGILWLAALFSGCGVSFRAGGGVSVRTPTYEDYFFTITEGKSSTEIYPVGNAISIEEKRWMNFRVSGRTSIVGDTTIIPDHFTVDWLGSTNEYRADAVVYIEAPRSSKHGKSFLIIRMYYREIVIVYDMWNQPHEETRVRGISNSSRTFKIVW